MKVYEIKSELEKMSKIIPELRETLKEAYASESSKKSRIKLLWKQYEDRHKEMRGSSEYRNLNLH